MTCSIYSVGVFTGIVSPLVKSYVAADKWFVVLPLWYPVDVTSSRCVHWCAFVWEYVMIWYTCFLYASIDVLYLYIIMSTRVKFEALGQFLRDDGGGRISPSQTSWRGPAMFEEGKQAEWTFDLSSVTDDRFNNIEDLQHEKLRRGLQDWQKLKGHAKLIPEIFKPYFAASFSIGMVANTVMAYAVVYELRHSESVAKAISESAMYIGYVLAACWHLGSISYNATVLQDTYDNLRLCLWEDSWYMESLKFKKLSLNFSMALSTSFKLKAFSFMPVDLETFSHTMNRSFSYFLFLLQLATAK
nr:PREDICTED: uncharacterized protein LOC109033105 [Bemisia tabaci]